MSEELLEVHRRSNAAFNRGDFDEWARYLHPNIIFEDRNPGPDQQSVTRGAERVRDIAEHWRESMPDMQIDIKEDVVAGDAVVSRVVYRGTGVTSGVSLDQTMVDVAWFEAGRIVRYSSGFSTLEEGMLAAQQSG